MKKKVSAIFVDDDEDDRRYAQRLTDAGLGCTAVLPPEELKELVAQLKTLRRNGACDIVFLDYRLDANPVEPRGRRVPYRGAEAAAAIRERLPGLPLVLVTTEPKLRRNLGKAPGLRGLFDLEVLKKRLANRHERKRVVVEVTDLAMGFHTISEASPSDWPGVARLLGAGEEGMTEVSRSQLPAGVAGLAAWLIHDLLRLSGPLLDEDAAAVLLGIARSSFLRSEVQEAITPARYTGPFGTWHPRWWKRGLEQWLASLPAPDDSEEEDERPRTIAGALGLSRHVIRAATCNWCRGRQVVQTCSICREPVDASHALVVVGDRPQWARRPVACYACIQAGRAEGVPFQPGTEAVVRALTSGDLRTDLSHG